MLKIILEILKLSIPAMGEMTLYMLIWVLDTMMVGKYAGGLGVSAVGISSEIMYTFTNIIISMGVSVSITSLVSRSMGAGDINLAKRYANTGLKFGLILALLLNIIFFLFSKHFLILAKTEGEVLDVASRYFRICSLGITFSMLISLINSVFRGCKDNKTPLFTATLINFVNLSLDYILIFGKFGFPALGVEGAAIATVIANIAGVLFLFFNLNKLPFNLDFRKKIYKPEFTALFKLALPSGLQEGAFSIARLINVIIVMSLGSLSFSANQIANTIESLSFMPGWGISISCMALVGYSVGEKNLKKAKLYTDYSLLIASITMGTIALIFFFFPIQLTSLFIKKTDNQVISLAAACMRIAALEQIPMALSMVLEGALKGSGDAKNPFRITLFTSWMIRLPLIWYFIYHLRKPVTFFWIVTAFSWTIQAFVLLYLYKKRGYEKVF